MYEVELETKNKLYWPEVVIAGRTQVSWPQEEEVMVHLFNPPEPAKQLDADTVEAVVTQTVTVLMLIP